MSFEDDLPSDEIPIVYHNIDVPPLTVRRRPLIIWGGQRKPRKKIGCPSPGRK